ncbi:MAG: bifunctional methylenetetrahydrofolate dehydrogenase/methenyltetrahydrofolate cyclohydrolase FolD [Promethearchaeota archaeon]
MEPKSSKSNFILDGKSLANELNSQLKKTIEDFKKSNNLKRKPGLATILIGDDPASKLYVKMKRNKCNEIGIISKHIELSENTTKEKVINTIQQLNTDDSIDGILVQLPLPDHLKPFTNEILLTINPDKDVDGFHPQNMGKILMGDESFAACTPKGMIRLLEKYNILIESQHVVIVNHSNVIGKPLALMFLNRDATVTVCHIKTINIESYLKKADIIAIGIGKPKFLTADKVKEGVVILDAGINKDEKGKLCGDADFEELKEKCRAITPVPGGVGPMTIAMLMENTFLTYKNRAFK